MRALVFVALAVIAVPDRQDPNKKDDKPFEEQLLGEWQYVKAVHGGQDAPIGNQDLVLIFGKDSIQVRQQGKIQDRDATGYHIDATRMPIAIDLMPKNGPMEKIPGILKLEGDELVICIAEPPGTARPTDFVSAPNSRGSVLYLKRIKK
jgi:uncharacterized protein (TIGR03067 family)